MRGKNRDRIALNQSGSSSCHDPDHAFGSAPASPVEMGGQRLDQPDVPAVPSLRCLRATL